MISQCQCLPLTVANMREGSFPASTASLKLRYITFAHIEQLLKNQKRRSHKMFCDSFTRFLWEILVKASLGRRMALLSSISLRTTAPFHAKALVWYVLLMAEGREACTKACQRQYRGTKWSLEYEWIIKRRVSNVFIDSQVIQRLSFCRRKVILSTNDM